MRKLLSLFQFKSRDGFAPTIPEPRETRVLFLAGLMNGEPCVTIMHGNHEIHFKEAGTEDAIEGMRAALAAARKLRHNPASDPA